MLDAPPKNVVLVYETEHYTSWTCARETCRISRSRSYPARIYQSRKALLIECREHPVCDEAESTGELCDRHRKRDDAALACSEDCKCHCHTGFCDECGDDSE